MELTFDGLTKEILLKIGIDDIKLFEDTILRTYIDGDDAYNLLVILENEFNVSFADFNFQQYFLEEWELSKGCLTFGLVKRRKIKHELTIGELYEYMKNNRK